MKDNIKWIPVAEVHHFRALGTKEHPAIGLSSAGDGIVLMFESKDVAEKLYSLLGSYLRGLEDE